LRLAAARSGSISDVTPFFVTFVAYCAKLRLRDKPPLEQTGDGAVYFYSMGGGAGRSAPIR
jgi:hypothetical protein